MQLELKTYINNICVGSGKWGIEQIKKYAKNKNIELKTAHYRLYHINFGFDYTHISVETGEVLSVENSDPYRDMLGR